MKVRSAVKEMQAYNPPLDMRTEQDYLLLDFNESTLPPAPGVIEAMKAFLDNGGLRRYPAYGSFLAKLARYTGMAEEQLLLTNGSDSAIQLIAQALLSEGDEMIMPTPGFFITQSSAQVQGATLVQPPYEDGIRFPLQGILAAVTDKTRLIAVISPNNPTGTLAPEAEIRVILEAHPHIPVFVDEAYFEFSGQTTAPLVNRYKNLLVTRTFSKALAIAGLRLGYVISNPEFISELSKIRIPYDVNSLAVVAAEALLDDQAPWQAYVREVMDEAKPLVERFLDRHGVAYCPSHANFLLVTPDNVQRAYEFLKERGILVRPQKPPVAHAFRMSIGRGQEMERFMEVFSQYLNT